MSRDLTLPMEVSCSDVKRMLDSGEDFLLLDCREDEEYATVHIAEALLLPMSQLQDRAAELEPERHRKVVVHCHHGGRSLMVAGWLRGQVNPEVTAETRCYPNALDTSTALTRGRALRAEIDAHADPVGVLVVADGAHTLTPSAPGGYDPESVAVQTALDDALAVGDVAALADLPAAVVGRVAFAVLAGLAEPGPAAARELYRGAPYGVGYFVGVWRP